MDRHWQLKALLGFFLPAAVTVVILMLAVGMTLR